MCGGFYCLFSVCALTFLRTEILYLENTVSPLNDCVYYNSSYKSTQKRVPLSFFHPQASSVACMVHGSNACLLSLCLPAVCHAGTDTLFLKSCRFLTSYIQSSHVLLS